MLNDTDVPIAPSTYYATKTRPPSARSIRDAEVTEEIKRVHKENYGVYGIRKVWAQVGRDGGVGGRPVARCTVARLMKDAGLRGISRVKTPRTTVRATTPDSRPDLVQRAFTAPAPDRGSQYLALRYTERLAEAEVVASVGSVGDSYDNAMAEAFNSLFKAELVRNEGPWQGIEDLEIAVAEYIDWYNHRRLHGEIGLLPPVEYENHYWTQTPLGLEFNLSTEPGT